MRNLDKLKARLASDGAELRGVTWDAGAKGMSEDDRAGEILRVIEHFDCPRNALVGRLRGEAFLLTDTATCLRKRFNVVKWEPVPPTPAEKRRIRECEDLAELLTQAADMLEGMAKPNEPSPKPLRAPQEKEDG